MTQLSRRALAVLAALLAALPAAAASSSAPSPTVSSPTPPTPLHASPMTTSIPTEPAGPTLRRDGARAFDFLHGTWRVHNRRLRHPLSRSSEWYEFEARAVERPLWDGQGNIEEYDATLPDGSRLRGLALRLYDPRAGRWSIHWSNSDKGTLDPAMTGTFRDGRGEFYGYEEYDGRMIFVRFLWTSRGADGARWEQAFSDDAGTSWETNWIMDFTRRSGVASAGAPGASSPLAGAGAHVGAANAAALTRTAPAATDVTAAAAAQTPCCPIVELRRYTVQPGTRDRFIELFDREFVESQEAVGMRIIAQFRDLDHPDAFTWLRGFPDMQRRAASLNAFYFGPVWAAHRGVANPMLVDNDNVRLLHPVSPPGGFTIEGERAAPGATAVAPGLVVVTIYTLDAPDAGGFPAFFQSTIAPRLAASGARPTLTFETDSSPNTFPRLPVREGEHAFVWFARYADVAAYDRATAALAADGEWTGAVQPALARKLRAPVEVWRLTPTARSRMPR